MPTHRVWIINLQHLQDIKPTYLIMVCLNTLAKNILLKIHFLSSVFAVKYNITEIYTQVKSVF